MWWKKLASILKPEDAIYFSIDGIENNFHIYRVNASWKKIMSHINILSSYDNGPSIIWKYILFRYNELDVNGISRNKDVINGYINDSLNHDQLSIKLGLDLLNYENFV